MILCKPTMISLAMATDILYIKESSTPQQNITKAAGDSVTDKSVYSELVKNPDWRLTLSDSAVSPFEWKGKQWKTAEHAIQSAKEDDSVAATYSLNSGSALARGSAADALASGKGKSMPSDEILYDIWKAKFTKDEKARHILGLTGDSQLWTLRGGKKIRWTALETIRQEAQRNATVEPEMADVPKEKKTRKPSTKKVVQEVPAPINAFAENTVATAAPKPAQITPPDLEQPEETDSSLKFCPVCDNYLYMEVDANGEELTRVCRKCGHKEQDINGGLVMEMMIQQKSSEGYKILLNEFTRKDPRLPHIRKNISCPNVTCDSNNGVKEPDVIYIKYDQVNLMYLYICDICGEKWHSRDRS